MAGTKQCVKSLGLTTIEAIPDIPIIAWLNFNHTNFTYLLQM